MFRCLFPFCVAVASSLRGESPMAPSIVDCGSGGITLSGLNLFPTAPTKGAPANLYANGTMTEVVSAGKIALAVYLDGVNLYSTQCSICGASKISLPLGLGSINMDGLTCPTAVGNTENIRMNLNLPAAVPSGNYNISMIGIAATSNSNVFCVDAQFPL